MGEYMRSCTVTTANRYMVDQGLTYGSTNIGRILCGIKALCVLIYKCTKHYYALSDVVVLGHVVLVDCWLPLIA